MLCAALNNALKSIFPRVEAALPEPKGGQLHKSSTRRTTDLAPTALDWSIPGAPDDPGRLQRGLHGFTSAIAAVVWALGEVATMQLRYTSPA